MNKQTLCQVTLFFIRLSGDQKNTTSTATVTMLLDLDSPDIEESIYEIFGDILHMDLYDYDVVDMQKLQNMNTKQ